MSGDRGAQRPRRTRQHRTRELVYGLHAAEAALEHHEQVVTAWAQRRSTAGRRLQEVVERAQRLGISVQEAGSRTLDGKARGGVHQGIVLEVLGAPPLDEAAFAALPGELTGRGECPLLLLLDGVTDPRNVGAAMRAALGAGAQALAVPRDRSSLLTPAARKCASGADRHLPFYALTNLARALEGLRAQGVRVLGLEGRAPRSLYDEDLSGPLALVLGGEEHGLRRLTREHCDALAAIPCDPRLESLNVATAAAVALYEARRQRLLSAAVQAQPAPDPAAVPPEAGGGAPPEKG